MKISIKRVVVAAILALTQITLLGLKALKIIDWSWTWVLAPVWMTYICAILTVAIMVIISAIYVLIERIKHGD